MSWDGSEPPAIGRDDGFPIERRSLFQDQQVVIADLLVQQGITHHPQRVDASPRGHAARDGHRFRRLELLEMGSRADHPSDLDPNRIIRLQDLDAAAPIGRSPDVPTLFEPVEVFVDRGR